MVKRQSRPIPKVAGPGAGPQRNGGGSYAGTKGTKTPTGARPVPKVARNKPTIPTAPGATKKPIRRTPMPAPNAAAQRSSRGRGYGSGTGTP